MGLTGEAKRLRIFIAGITEDEVKISAFLPKRDDLFAVVDSGGLIAMENVQVIQYRAGKK